MAECMECGKKLGFLEQSVGGLCSQCNYLSTISPDEAEQLDQVKQDWENTQVQLSIDEWSVRLNHNNNRSCSKSQDCQKN